MDKLASVAVRQNSYAQKTQNMMNRQTRAHREASELEKRNLGLYLQIVHTKPIVTKVDKLR